MDQKVTDKFLTAVKAAMKTAGINNALVVFTLNDETAAELTTVDAAAKPWAAKGYLQLLDHVREFVSTKPEKLQETVAGGR